MVYILLFIPVQRWAMCSFTDGDLCDFVLDESLGVQWMPVNKNSKKVDVLRPKYDYTTMTGQWWIKSYYYYER